MPTDDDPDDILKGNAAVIRLVGAVTRNDDVFDPDVPVAEREELRELQRRLDAGEITVREAQEATIALVVRRFDPEVWPQEVVDTVRVELEATLEIHPDLVEARQEAVTKSPWWGSDPPFRTPALRAAARQAQGESLDDDEGTAS